MPTAEEYLAAILLGVLQGLTEWLPISSSGHLVLAQHFFGIDMPIFFDLLLHLGTLVVVLVYYRKVIVAMLAAVLRTPKAAREAGSWRAAGWDDPDRRLALLVVIATVPTAIIGLTFRGLIHQLYASPLAAAIGLLLTGALLWTTRLVHARPRALGVREAVAIGVAQGVAIAPGVSRSGTTVATARLLGVAREDAVRYSFLLAIPAIVGAAILETDASAIADAGAHWQAYLAGTIAAMGVGYAALRLLVLIVERDLLHVFAIYCWTLGLAALALLTLASR